MTPLIFYLHGDGFRQIGHAVLILLAKPLILLFNSNPVIVDYGRWLLTSQLALYPAFGLCYMMTITF